MGSGRRAAGGLLIAMLCASSPGGPAEAADWRDVTGPAVGLGTGLHFVDARDGWLLKDDPKADTEDTTVGHRTSDGGNVWEEIHIPGFRESLTTRYSWVAGYGPFSAARLSSREAWVGGSELIAHTTDAGETWEIIHLWPALTFTDDLIRLASQGVFIVRGLRMYDSSNGIMLLSSESAKDGASGGSVILSTQDGGHSWADPRGAPGVRLAASASRGAIATYGGAGLHRTEDAGRTWHALLGERATAAYVGGQGSVWAISAAFRDIDPVRLIRSGDMGRTWAPVVVLDPTPADFQWNGGLSALAFAPDGRGWAVGALGVVLATDDGQTWTREPTPTEARLLDVQYIDGVVYAAGEDGAVLKRDATGTTVPTVRAAGKGATSWGRVKESR